MYYYVNIDENNGDFMMETGFYFGFTELLMFLPVKIKAIFLSIFFLGQGILGPVSPDLVPKQNEINKFNKSYYEMELPKTLRSGTYMYGFINRLDIGSQNFVSTDFGKKLSAFPIKKFIDIIKNYTTFSEGEDPIVKLKQIIKSKTKLSADDFYALTKSKIEFALTNYESEISFHNILIAYYPEIKKSQLAINKIIKIIEQNYGKKIRKENNSLYKLWKFDGANNQVILLSQINNKKIPFYVVCFSEKTFKSFISDYKLSKKLFYNQLKKDKIIEKMGKGVYTGIYVSIKDIFKKSKTFNTKSNEKVKNIYNFIGIKDLVISESFKDGIYYEKTELSYDQEQNSFLKKLVPIPLTKKDFNWLPNDTRLLFNLSIKDLDKKLDWLGDFVRSVGGEREHKSYKRDLDWFKRKSNFNLDRMLGILDGKFMFAINGEDTFFEDISTSLYSLERTFGYFLLKKIMVSFSVKDELGGSVFLTNIINALPLQFQSPPIKNNYLNQPYEKIIINIKYEKSPIYIYWTYLDKKIIVCFSEKNIRKVIQSIKSNNSAFYKRLGINKLYKDVLYYFWMDYTYALNQSVYLYEMFFSSMRQRKFMRYDGDFHFKTLIPFLRDISTKIGSVSSSVRFTDKGIISESMSESFSYDMMGGFYASMTIPAFWMYYSMSKIEFKDPVEGK